MRGIIWIFGMRYFLSIMMPNSVTFLLGKVQVLDVFLYQLEKCVGELWRATLALHYTRRHSRTGLKNFTARETEA